MSGCGCVGDLPAKRDGLYVDGCLFSAFLGLSRLDGCVFRGGGGWLCIMAALSSGHRGLVFGHAVALDTVVDLVAVWLYWEECVLDVKADGL